MERTQVDVTGCDDCPFFYDSFACQHPVFPVGRPMYDIDGFDTAVAPACCPLRSADILVQLRAKL